MKLREYIMHKNNHSLNYQSPISILDLIVTNIEQLNNSFYYKDVSIIFLDFVRMREKINLLG